MLVMLCAVPARGSTDRTAPTHCWVGAVVLAEDSLIRVFDKAHPFVHLSSTSAVGTFENHGEHLP